MSRKAIAITAVRTVVTHGASVLERLAMNSGSNPSSANWASVRAAPAKGAIVP